jgi:hypothetical protein
MSTPSSPIHLKRHHASFLRHTDRSSTRILVGNREGAVDPAIGVHNATGNAFDDAIDGISDVLSRRDEDGTCDEEDHGALVVQAEDVVVDPYGVELEEVLHLSKDAQHVGFVPSGALHTMRFLNKLIPVRLALGSLRQSLSMRPGRCDSFSFLFHPGCRPCCCRCRCCSGPVGLSGFLNFLRPLWWRVEAELASASLPASPGRGDG